MFTPAERDRVRDLLLERARDDDTIVAAAVTGSGARGGEDRWSDVDLFLGVAEPTAPRDALEAWTVFVYRDLGALHHFDLDVGYAIYRAFLLPDALEVDIAFAQADRFGPLGPLFRTVFGTPVEQPVGGAGGGGAGGGGAGGGGVEASHLIGLAWHHVLHAKAAIARGRPWQAEHWISALRDHVLTLACLRCGLPTAYAKGVDGLPPAITGPLAATLVRSLQPQELSRCLTATVGTLLREVDAADPDLAARLRPALQAACSPAT